MLKKLKKKWRYLNKKTKKYITIGSVALLILAIYFYIFYKLPNPSSLAEYRVVPLSTHILDRKGRLLYEIYREQSRTPIKLNTIPKYIAQATISIEDKDFYHHGGVSIIGGVLRAIKDTLLRRKLQGGSTITQQLIKSALLTPERTIRRKIREIILALWTEKIYSKDKILELYLNQVPYGGAAYGVEEAARIYFSKKAKNLSLSEAALLAGLPQAPSIYSPFYNLELARARRNEVLKAMLNSKYIDQKTYEKETKKEVKINPPKTTINAPHFVFYVKSQLEKTYDIQEIEEGGMQVTTSLDLDIQKKSEAVLKDQLEELKNLDVGNGAILVTRPPTGEILSMVGSADYFATPSGAFNVATALRQPGSSIKPLNYAIGLERRLVTPATVFLDVPTCFSAAGQPKAYCPENYDGTFHGPVQLRFALGNSYNIPAVKMLAVNGVANFVASASAFGITTFKDPKNYGLSLTLGGGEVRMTDMATAFSAFANRGTSKKLVSILKIQDRNGKVLYQYKDPNFVEDMQKPVSSPNFFAISGSHPISQETSFLISHILLDNNARSAAFGEKSYLVIPGHAVSVKTGTTDDKKDNWTIGFTPNFLTVVWVGNNDNTPMNPYLTSGVTGAAPIWNQVMTFVLKNQPDLWPVRPANIIGKQVCWSTGITAEKKPDGSDNCQARFEYFIRGTENAITNVSKQIIPVNKDTGQLARPQDSNIEMKEKTVIRDAFSIYCVDCAHPKDEIQSVQL